MADTELHDTQDTTPKDTFWADFAIPYNDDYRRDGTSFVNPVTVQEEFIRATGHAAYFGQLAETGTKKLDTLDTDIAELEQQIAAIKERVLAGNLTEAAKIKNLELQAAFVLANVEGADKAEYTRLRAELAKKQLAHLETKKRRDRIKSRLDQLNKRMEWLKQFLDYDKLERRIKGGQH